MPTYQYKCPEGHVIEEVHRMADHPQVVHCVVHDKPAHRAILRDGAPFYSVDNVDKEDWTQTAGNQAKRWKTKWDRDKWLTENNMQVVPMDHPAHKESAEYLDHLRAERRAIEAKGERWQDHEAEKERVEREKATQDAADVGITIEKLDAAEMTRRMNDPRNKEAIEKRGQDSRWFQERVAMLPASTPMSAAIPDMPADTLFPELSDSDLET